MSHLRERHFVMTDETLNSCFKKRNKYFPGCLQYYDAWNTHTGVKKNARTMELYKNIYVYMYTHTHIEPSMTLNVKETAISFTLRFC